MTGTLYGLGVGPGDPELITIKALRILSAAKVIAYPAPEHGQSMARAIVAPHLSGGQREIAIHMKLVPGSFPEASVYAGAAEDISLRNSLAVTSANSESLMSSTHSYWADRVRYSTTTAICRSCLCRWN
jgi:precorrin-2 methylase